MQKSSHANSLLAVNFVSVFIKSIKSCSDTLNGISSALVSYLLSSLVDLS